jgi:hypothetical protein
MKQMKITLMFFIFSVLLSSSSQAMIMPTTATSPAQVETQKKELKKEFKAQKRMAKLEKFLKKAGVDFKDPVNKWMWFWIFGWGIALLVNIIAAVAVTGGAFGAGGLWILLGTIALLAGLFGTVSLVIWLVKKFGG